MSRGETRIAIAIIMALGLLPTLLPADAGAQSARRVPGYWVGLGAAGALAGLNCESCADTESRIGPSAALTIGRTLSPSLGVGLELSGWRKGVHGAVDHQGYLMATAFFFPGQRGAYLAGSLGVARFASASGRGGDRTTTLGGAWRVGAGYDFPFGREISLAPFVSYFRSVPAGLKINGNALGIEITQHMIQLGVGLQWNFSSAIAFPKPTP
jgi:hypothetical protein